MIWALTAMLPLILVAIAVWLFAGARAREGEEAFAERVGQAGTGDFVDELAGLRHLQRIRNPVTRTVCHRFWGAGVDVAPGNVNIALIAFGVLLVLLLLADPVLGLLLGVGVVGLGALVLQQRVRARRRAVADQLPDYLEYVLRALAAGNTLEESLQSAALEAAEPCRSLFLSVARQVRLGAPVEATLSEAAEVHGLRALHIMALSARVNRRYGGSMRRVIKSLIATIRQQDAATRELKALTGETRFSAWVVAAIPIAISAVFYLMNPGYYDAMLDSNGGRIALGIAVALQVLGIVIIWRMVAGMRDAAL